MSNGIVLVSVPPPISAIRAAMDCSSIRWHRRAALTVDYSILFAAWVIDVKSVVTLSDLYCITHPVARPAPAPDRPPPSVRGSAGQAGAPGRARQHAGRT